MLTITVLGEEFFNEKTSEIYTIGDVVLELEHSLVTLSKWESKYEKPFLSSDSKTSEEVVDYIRFMILTPDYPPDILSKFSQKNFTEVNDYLNAKMTATWFSESKNQPKSREVITSELIYYWMIAFGVPMECENWHLNRLFTLIKVCSAKSQNQDQKPRKPTADDMAARRKLNAERQAKYGTKG